MGDNDLVRRGDVKAFKQLFDDSSDDYPYGHLVFAVTIKDIDCIPAVPHEMSVAEESRLRVSWRWLEDFAREYKSEQYAEFILAAKRAYVSSIEKMYGLWAREHSETDMMTAKYALPKIDFEERSES